MRCWLDSPACNTCFHNNVRTQCVNHCLHLAYPDSGLPSYPSFPNLTMNETLMSTTPSVVDDNSHGPILIIICFIMLLWTALMLSIRWYKRKAMRIGFKADDVLLIAAFVSIFESTLIFTLLKLCQTSLILSTVMIWFSVHHGFGRRADQVSAQDVVISRQASLVHPKLLLSLTHTHKVPTA